MNRNIFVIRIVVTLGMVCLGALAVVFAGKSQASPAGIHSSHSAIPANAKNVEMVNSFGGETHDLVVMGNYTYLALGQKLLVLDLSDPVNPVSISQIILPDPATALVADGSILYVAAGTAGLRVVNISNPAVIEEIGSYIPEVDPYTGYQKKNIHNVAISGGHAYATFDGKELHILDVSNPSQPVQIGFYQLPGEGQEIAIVGNYAYVASDEIGITILDITDPVHPVQAGEYASPYSGPATGMALSGSWLYLARGCTLQLVDISQPVNLLGGAAFSLPWCEKLTGIEVSGNFTYLVDGDELGILEVTNFQTISLIFEASFNWSVTSIAVAGNIAYAGSDNGINILDLSTPSSPEFIGDHQELGGCYEIVASGNYAYAACYSMPGVTEAPLVVWDISDPSGFIQFGVFQVGNALHLAPAGNHLYVSNYNNDIRIMDISDPMHPIEAGVYNNPGWNVGGLYAAGNYLYVNIYYPLEGLKILDITNPLNPVEVGTYSMRFSSMFVRNGNAYLLSTIQNNLTIVDVSDPAHPVEKSKLQFPGEFYTIEYMAVAGDFIYVSRFLNGGLLVVDVSNPSQPNLASSIPGDYYHIAATSEYLYLTQSPLHNNNVRVMDIHEPGAPVDVGFFQPPCAGDEFALNDYVYLATCEGTGVYRFTGLSIDGQVVQANRLPVPDVTLAITPALTATTNLSGDFTFGELARGTYTVTPALPGFIFWPDSRTLTLPPNGVHQDFTLLPLPVSITLTPGLSNTLTLTDTQGLTTTVFFPAEAVTETLTLTLTPTAGIDGGEWSFSGHAFDLAVYHEGALLPGFTFTVPVTVTIHYSDADIRVVKDESQLALWAWAGGHWQDAAQFCESPAGYQRDEDGNVIRIAVCRAGSFKLVGPTYPIFLPAVFSQ